MSVFISPVADDPVTKLQNLLQNTLYSFADITVTFAPEKFKELQDACAKAGVNIEKCQKSDQVPAENPKDEATNDNEHRNTVELMDRAERIGQLNDHIQATVDELPDTSISKEEILSQITLLNEECERASEELKLLYTEFDAAFQALRANIGTLGVKQEP